MSYTHYYQKISIQPSSAMIDCCLCELKLHCIYNSIKYTVAAKVKSPPLNISDLTEEIHKTLKKINAEKAVLYTAPPPSADSTEEDSLLMSPCKISGLHISHISDCNLIASV